MDKPVAHDLRFLFFSKFFIIFLFLILWFFLTNIFGFIKLTFNLLIFYVFLIHINYIFQCLIILLFNFSIFINLEPNKLCDFKKSKGKLLKTVDSVHEDVKTENECKDRCINAPYRCFSFDLGDPSSPVCRTSHLDRASLSHIEEPYTEVSEAVTWELYACYNGKSELTHSSN